MVRRSVGARYPGLFQRYGRGQTQLRGGEGYMKGTRILQSDVERVLKAVKAVGFSSARITVDLPAQTIEIVIGEGAVGTTIDEDEAWRMQQPLWQDDFESGAAGRAKRRKRKGSDS